MASRQYWTETETGTFYQDYGFMGKFFHGVNPAPYEGQHGHLMVAGVVSFRYAGPGSDIVGHLQRAWLEMRFRFPALAASTEPNGRTYSEPSDEEIQAWMKSTFHCHDDKAETAEGYYRSIISTSPPQLHVFRHTSELLLVSPHHYIDAKGILVLYKSIFLALASQQEQASIEKGIGALPPTSDQLLVLEDARSEKNVSGAVGWLKDLSAGRPIKMPLEEPLPPPIGHFVRTVVELSESETRSVLNACKTHGYTVTAAWHASLGLATYAAQQSAGASEGDTFVALSNVDLRRHFSPQLNTDLFLAEYISTLPAKIEVAGGAFDSIASSAADFYNRATSSETLPTLPFYTEKLLAGFKAKTNSSIAMVLSSLGRLDKHLPHTYGDSWEIEDIWIDDTMMTPMPLAFLWTWKNKMRMSLSGNGAYYTPEDLAEVLSKVKEILLKI